MLPKAQLKLPVTVIMKTSVSKETSCAHQRFWFFEEFESSD
jgi:hypothetical protein